MPAGSAAEACRPQGRLNSASPHNPTPHNPANPHAHPVFLLSQGVVKERHFQKFTSEAVRTEAAARKVLADHGVAHYYDLCVAFNPE